MKFTSMRFHHMSVLCAHIEHGMRSKHCIVGWSHHHINDTYVERETRFSNHLLVKSSQLIEAELDLSKLGYQRYHLPRGQLRLSQLSCCTPDQYSFTDGGKSCDGHGMGMGSGAAVPFPSGNHTL